MKKLFLLSINMVFLGILAAQFGPENIINLEPNVSGRNAVYQADLDGDGDEDILAASFGDDKIVWYENLGGGLIGPMNIISNSAQGAMSVISADLDNDGDLDVISGSFDDNKVAWYENICPGSFGPEQIISVDSTIGSSPYSPHSISVYSDDMDNDGDMDVMSVSSISDKILWFENLGSGSFGSENLILTDYGLHDAKFGDLDNDGDLDLINHEGHSLYFYENIGGQIYGPGEDLTNYIGSGFCLAGLYSFELIDTDADGDLDIAYSYSGDWCGEGGIDVVENLGDGNFIDDQTLLYLGHEIQWATLKDIDGDGDMDFIWDRHRNYEFGGGLYVSENLGDWEHGEPQQLINYQTLWYVNDQNFSVSVIDVDQNGDVDILVGGDEISWIENQGSATFGNLESISKKSAPTSIYTADLDGDGDSDVVSAFEDEDKITWYENIGQGSFAPQQIISNDVDEPRSVHSTDLDGDGDMDILSASYNDNKIAWYENLGSGSFGPQHIVATIEEGANIVTSSDLDNDGDMDVVASSYLDGKLAWYENIGGGLFGPTQIINNTQIQPTSIHCSDIDGDGFIDIVLASRTFNEHAVLWYKNIGDGSFESKQVITEDSDTPQSVFSADLDEDGDMDVISASRLDDKIAWFENLGQGSFSLEQIISTEVDGACSVFCVDLNGNGKIDVLSASFFDNKIRWFENFGGGSFGDQQIISTNATGNTLQGVNLDYVPGRNIVYSEDLDNDGDMDVLSASLGDHKLAWYDNNYIDLDNDLDNDGITDDEDCAPTNPIIYPGAPCDDCDPNTENDIILADCSCGNSCPTDFNEDGKTDGADFNIFLGNYGISCSFPCQTDIDGNGITDGADFSIFIGNYGLFCN